MVACTGLYRTACTCRVLLYHAIPCNNVLYVPCTVAPYHAIRSLSLATCCTCRVVVKQPPTPTTHHHQQQHHQQCTRNDLPCSFLLPGLQPRWTLSGRSTRLQAGPPRKAAARDSTSGVRRSGSLAKPRAGCCVVPGCRHAGGYVAKRFVGRVTHAGTFVGDTATGSKAPANTTAAMQFPRVGNNGALVPVGFAIDGAKV